MTNKLTFTLFFTFLFIAAQAQDSLSFLALGDSYTIGESVAQEARWPVQLRDSLNTRGYKIKAPFIIARTGWRTDELKTAIEKQSPDKNYDMVGLLIGVNNQYQGKTAASYRPAFKELLQMAIIHAGGDKSKVFVLSIPDYGYTLFGAKDQKRISAELNRYNSINKQLSKEAGVKYYNITDISRSDAPELVASDDLHPSGVQYSLWVQRVLKDPEFFQLLSN